MTEKRLDELAEKYIQAASIPPSKKWCFSKKLSVMVISITAFVVIYACIAMWHFNNLDYLEYLIPAVFTECGAVTSFYFWKAKAENNIKLEIQRSLVNRLLDEDIEKEYFE